MVSGDFFTWYYLPLSVTVIWFKKKKSITERFSAWMKKPESFWTYLSCLSCIPSDTLTYRAEEIGEPHSIMILFFTVYVCNCSRRWYYTCPSHNKYQIMSALRWTCHTTGSSLSSILERVILFSKSNLLSTAISISWIPCKNTEKRTWRIRKVSDLITNVVGARLWLFERTSVSKLEMSAVLTWRLRGIKNVPINSKKSFKAQYEFP